MYNLKLEIKNVVDKIIVDILFDRTSLDTIHPEIHLIDDLQVIPVELLEIFTTIMATYNIELSPEATRHFKIISDLYAFIHKTATPHQIQNSSKQLKELKYVKTFADVAYKLDILTDNVVECLETFIGFSVRPKINIDGIKLSSMYLMQHLKDGCQANCSFCVQSKETKKKRKHSMLVNKKLMRFPMPIFSECLKSGELEKKGLERFCIQTVYNKRTIPDLLDLVSSVRSVSNIPLTACSIPVSKKTLTGLKDAGLDMIVINYETATPELFSAIRGSERKGPYTWQGITKSIDHAIDVFGPNKVGSHLQIGFGESQRDALKLIQSLKDKKAFVSLFAFRPLAGTALENNKRISYARYHQLQLASYLIQNTIVHIKDMLFDDDGNISSYGISNIELKKYIMSGNPFRNRGCPGCNRVYFDTDPGERFYSYPRNLLSEELDIIKQEIFSDISKNYEDISLTETVF